MGEMEIGKELTLLGGAQRSVHYSGYSERKQNRFLWPAVPIARSQINNIILKSAICNIFILKKANNTIVFEKNWLQLLISGDLKNQVSPSRLISQIYFAAIGQPEFIKCVRDEYWTELRIFFSMSARAGIYVFKKKIKYYITCVSVGQMLQNIATEWRRWQYVQNGLGEMAPCPPTIPSHCDKASQKYNCRKPTVDRSSGKSLMRSVATKPATYSW